MSWNYEVVLEFGLLLSHSAANFPLGEYEELVLNGLATLNNLSYYAQPDSCIVLRQQEVAQCKFIKKPIPHPSPHLYC